MTYSGKFCIIKPMRTLWLLLLPIFLPMLAEAGTVSRLYDFEPNTKAQADQVDDELDNIISTINGNIDSSNLATGAFDTANIANGAITTAKLADGSVTTAKMATGTSAYIKNYRKGCNLTPSAVYAVTQSVNVNTPCEVIIDGQLGTLSVNSAVSALDTGSFSSNTFYYVYGTPTTSNGITFELSATTPNVGTFRKTGDATKRYIGSLVTSATASIGRFKQNGNKYRVYRDGVQPYIAQRTFTGALAAYDTNVNVTPIAKNITADVNADYAAVSGGPSCAFELYSIDSLNRIQAQDKIYMPASLATPISTFTLPVDNRRLNFFANCTTGGGNTFTDFIFGINGWEEPAELY